MIRTAFLTFVITALFATVVVFFFTIRNQAAEKRRLLKENGDLKRQVSDYTEKEQRHRECAAYDRGLYDGRTTDTYYRQCLKKLQESNQKTKIIMDGEMEEEINE